jgi:hypothetical protein
LAWVMELMTSMSWGNVQNSCRHPPSDGLKVGTIRRDERFSSDTCDRGFSLQVFSESFHSIDFQPIGTVWMIERAFQSNVQAHQHYCGNFEICQSWYFRIETIIWILQKKGLFEINGPDLRFFVSQSEVVIHPTREGPK